MKAGARTNIPDIVANTHAHTMSDAEPPPTPREEEDRFPGMDADKQVNDQDRDDDKDNDKDNAPASASDSDSASDQAAEDAQETSPPAPEAPREDAGRSLPAAAASTAALEGKRSLTF